MIVQLTQSKTAVLEDKLIEEWQLGLVTSKFIIVFPIFL